MLSLETSIPNSPLPFGADNVSHAAWQRPHTARDSTHHNAQAISHLHAKSPEPSNHPTFPAVPQTSDITQRRPSASIAPLPTHNTSYKIKDPPKNPNTHLWLLATAFQLSVIALTSGLTLLATTPHSHHHAPATQTAAIVLATAGFAGTISTLALIRLSWNRRQKRSRLENNNCVFEQQVSNTLNPRATQSAETAIVRARSLRSNSSRAVPSFREMTPSPQSQSHEATSESRIEKDRISEMNHASRTTNAELDIALENARSSTSTTFLDIDDDGDDDGSSSSLSASADEKGEAKGILTAAIPNILHPSELQLQPLTATATTTTTTTTQRQMQDRELEVAIRDELEEGWSVRSRSTARMERGGQECGDGGSGFGSGFVAEMEMEVRGQELDVGTETVIPPA